MLEPIGLSQFLFRVSDTVSFPFPLRPLWICSTGVSICKCAVPPSYRNSDWWVSLIFAFSSARRPPAKATCSLYKGLAARIHLLPSRFCPVCLPLTCRLCVGN